MPDTKCRKMMEFENYHLAKIILITDSGKNSEELLKLGCESLMQKRIFTKSQSTFDKILMRYKSKQGNLIANQTPP